MNENMSMGKRIRQLRQKNGLTQNQMATKLNITPASFSSYERDNSIPPGDKLAQIAEFLFTTMDYLACRIDDPSPIDILFKRNEKTFSALTDSKHLGVNKIPLVGSICAGEGIVASGNIEDYVLYPFLDKKQPDYALRVEGNSMIKAGIEDGDIVFLRKANWAEFNGQIVAAVINNEEGMLKRMKWDSGSPVIRLVPENEEYSTKEALPNEIIICGVYEGHFKPSQFENIK